MTSYKVTFKESRGKLEVTTLRNESKRATAAEVMLVNTIGVKITSLVTGLSALADDVADEEAVQEVVECPR